MKAIFTFFLSNTSELLVELRFSGMALWNYQVSPLLVNKVLY